MRKGCHSRPVRAYWHKGKWRRVQTKCGQFSVTARKATTAPLYVQPFVAYTTAGINSESSYVWKASQWSAPVNLTLTQILKVGKQPLSLQVGVLYWRSVQKFERSDRTMRKPAAR
jgi:hypothetical protein